MSKHWTTTLQCPQCHTRIRYENEVPSWRESERLRALIEEADLWLAENEGEVAYLHIRTVNLTGPDEPAVKQHDAAWAKFAPVLQMEDFGFHTVARAVKRNLDLRCVDCPACDAEVFVKHAIEAASREDGDG